ncbi:MAG: 5'-nucleotidase C-terminal domain-containing protein [Bryobacterales bacterium]|nr:5'-nucleotidase C-terminal domain-containing protein [Bryobacterales bacterium]
MPRLILCLLACCAAFGQDLKLHYRSPIDGTEQPYRLYLPAGHDLARAYPLVIAMHGTGGNQDTLFDGEAYQVKPLKAAADRHGMIVVSPFGRGVTEFRGIGEHDVLSVLEDVQRRYRIDPTRITLTGHSMGGTGAAYLALHRPDVFAAAAPLAAAYSFPWLARNALTTPFLWIGGAEDSDFYHRGVSVGVERMRKFGVPVLAEVLPGEGHRGPVKDFDRVLAWLAAQRLDPHPRAYFFEADTPLHGQAWWTAIEAMREPGRMASIEAAAASSAKAQFKTNNVAAFCFDPDPEVFRRDQPVEVWTDGSRVFTGAIPAARELCLTHGRNGWQARVQTAKPRPMTAWRAHPVATAPESLDMTGTEKRLANWITDAMRAATGADLALYNGWAYRGLPLPQGTVDIVDLVQCSRPFDQYLVTVELTGRDIVEILEDNIPHPKKDRTLAVDMPGASRLVQLSGARYAYTGHKVVESTLVPDRVYRVAMEGQVVERESILLAGRFKKLDYRTTGVPLTLALYGHTAKSGKIVAAREGRVREVR